MCFMNIHIVTLKMIRTEQNLIKIFPKADNDDEEMMMIQVITCQRVLSIKRLAGGRHFKNISHPRKGILSILIRYFEVTNHRQV